MIRSKVRYADFSSFRERIRRRDEGKFPIYRVYSILLPTSEGSALLLVADTARPLSADLHHSFPLRQQRPPVLVFRMAQTPDPRSQLELCVPLHCRVGYRLSTSQEQDIFGTKRQNPSTSSSGWGGPPAKQPKPNVTAMANFDGRQTASAAASDQVCHRNFPFRLRPSNEWLTDLIRSACPRPSSYQRRLSLPSYSKSASSKYRSAFELVR